VSRPAQPDSITADTRSICEPLLCVIVDTEEEFDWTGPFSRKNVNVNSLQGLVRVHALFRRYGLQPTYLVDFPVVEHPAARDIFGPWAAAGECVVGAQLHPWVNPPFEEVVCPLNSYPCNLDPELERRKLTALTERIRDALGIAPEVYKAGRYGLDFRIEATLRELGYLVDTSIMPYRDSSGFANGPDFSGYPEQPFWTKPDRHFLYLPVTQSPVGPLRGLARTNISRWLFGRTARRLHLPGVLARLGLLELIMLTPEGPSAVELRRLATALLRAGQRVFTLSLHSPSLVPGSTPYVRSEQDLAAFLTKIEDFFSVFFGELRGRPIDPLALRALLNGLPARPISLPAAG
jgi:hypothetical protein